ncbi:MAG TPA: BamA/TamA family outer membrane protein [Chitinophagaceae bacterium]|nr:BamA/TamA family outer membrane protein [Chitinophagaceae bacterium]
MPLIETKHVNSYLLFALGLCLSVISSCTVVKKYPKNTPFIFENTVNIKGEVEKDRKADLKSELEKQIEDSASVFANSKLPWPKAPWIIPVPVIQNPSVFDSVHVMQSTINLRNLMVAKGYRTASVTYDSSMTIYKDQYRVKVKYNVDAGKLYRIDSVGYNLNDSNLLYILQEHNKTPKLKKGEPFDYASVDEELNNMVNIFRNHGYYKISREDFFVEADSGFAALIDPTIDPFEYIRRLAEIEERRRENPQVDIYFRQYPIRDSSRFSTFTIGTFTVYPDAPSELNTEMRDTTETHIEGFKIVSFQNTFKPSFIASQIELKPGYEFSQDHFSRTLNNLNKLGVWQNINILPRTNDSLKTIDYFLRLSPAKKQFFSVDLEGSSVLNTNQLILVGSGRVGLYVNFRLRNRNIGKRAIQLENTLRTGIEFNDFSKILSSEITQGNRITIPWLLTPFSKKFENKFQSGKTIVAFDISYINRFQYYELFTINTFLGYEWKPKSNVTWQFKPLNIELTRIRPDSLFKDAIQQNPLLVYAYNNGFVFGTNLSYSRNFIHRNPRHASSIRLFGEESGLLLGELFKNQTASGKVFGDLYRFVRLDIDYRHYFNKKKTSWVFRAFAGYGLAFNTESRKGDVTLPFFKSYYSGGPNSMRGWQIRKLGIGSSVYFDTLANGTFNDKYADIRLEANLEYRFNLFRLFGFWFRGALFTDVGNIWFRNDLDGQLPGAEFSLAKLNKDLGVSSGAGMRMDFTYFILRFDWGFPLKDPRYGPDKSSTKFFTENKNGWFVDGVWNKPTFQFAIGYPF